jgi:hypothetical protein
MVGFNPEVRAQGKGKPPACDDVSVDLSLTDPAASVTSDGGSYPAELNCNNDTNNLSLVTETGRGMDFTLTAQSSGLPLTLSPGEDLVGTSLGASIADEGGILAMDVLDVAVTTKVQFAFVLNGKRYFLSWGSNYTGASTATVTHTDANTWEIETSADPNNKARLRECPANGACKSPVDRFYFAPLSMTLVRPPS